ncbi:hypothetical protein FHX48_000541 [Microbacterium halimionae]|uniref:HD domain-containing protein n=1 Tax=Microbacterium halimionae TaxID=1526413 RepID=A0A7W3PL44_9MICO|nr:HD domain-containing protein [Microbacterium halimionae]MBA8815489.1 hypothetical protein [Microbacterium halimionae]NII95536.1 hypothetical protein [Microbacterium halimionae]
MTTSIDEMLAPPTETAKRALDVAQHWCTPAVVNHCLRSWVWARALGESLELDIDLELLFVATMLHDTGVSAPFDSHTEPFERSGGAAGWTFATGAGWPRAQAERVSQIIERHMWTSVDVEDDPESYLLEAATSLDVSYAEPERWDAALLESVTLRIPRLGFASEFAAAIHEQASRKPKSNAARLDRSRRIGAGAAGWAALAAS